MRSALYKRYERFLGHELSEKETDELTAYYDECRQNIISAARGGCVATAGTFIREARYIKNIIDRKSE